MNDTEYPDTRIELEKVTDPTNLEKGDKIILSYFDGSGSRKYVEETFRMALDPTTFVTHFDRTLVALPTHHDSGYVKSKLGTSLGTDARLYVERRVNDPDAEMKTRAIAVSPLETDRKPAKMWEVSDIEGEDAYRMKQIRPYEKSSFKQPAARFEMYARIGVYLVNIMEVTDEQFENILSRLEDLTDSELIAFAGENRSTPPEGSADE